MIKKKGIALALAVATMLSITPINSIQASAATNGWQQYEGSWYYMNSSGTMVTGWNKVDGKWYYFYDNGSMAASTTISGYYVGSDGAWIPATNSKARTGLDVIPTLLNMGYFYPDGYSDSTKVRQLCLREGGKANNYTYNKIVFITSEDASIGDNKEDMLIVVFRKDADTNSELDKLFKVIMPGYEDQLMNFYRSTEGSDSADSYGHYMSSKTIGGRTIVKNVFKTNTSIGISPQA